MFLALDQIHLPESTKRLGYLLTTKWGDAVDSKPVQSAEAETAEIKSPRFVRLIVSSFLGTTLESFDFNIYTLLTPLVFNRLFFPQLEPAIATIASFSVLAVGLFSRIGRAHV